MLYRNSERIRDFLGFLFLLKSSFLYFGGVFNRTIIPLALVGYGMISIITQVIIEILALSLAENGVIFRYNHLRRGDYSGRTRFSK